jgi:SulP family sulfate permease
VPLAALAGILLFVAWNMGEWREFGRLRHFSLHYRTILVGTFVLTVVFDVTVAVEVGLVLACVFFIVRMSSLFRAQPLPADPGTPPPPGVHVVALFGALFFGAVGKVEALAQQLPADTRVLVLDMHRLISLDTSGLEALGQLHRSLQRRGTALVLVAVTEQPLSLMQRSGFAAELGTQHIVATMEAAWAAMPHPG